MSDISLDVSLDSITPCLNKLANDVGPRGRAALLKNLGREVAAVATRAFDEPDLRPAIWPARSGKSKYYKPGNWPLLKKKMLLWRSIRVSEANEWHVVVSSDRPYAIYHQTGTRNMPARPFFPEDGAGNPTPAIMARLAMRARAWMDRIAKG